MLARVNTWQGMTCQSQRLLCWGERRGSQEGNRNLSSMATSRKDVYWKGTVGPFSLWYSTCGETGNRMKGTQSCFPICSLVLNSSKSYSLPHVHPGKYSHHFFKIIIINTSRVNPQHAVEDREMKVHTFSGIKMPLTWTTSCELYPSTSREFFPLFSRATLESRDSWLWGNISLFLESGKRHIPSSCERTGAEASWRDRLSPDPNVLSTVEKGSAYFVSEMNQEKFLSQMAFRKSPSRCAWRPPCQVTIGTQPSLKLTLALLMSQKLPWRGLIKPILQKHSYL